MMVSLVFFLHPFLLVAQGWVWSGSRLVLSLLPFPSPSHSPSHGAKWVSKEVAFSSFCLVHLLPFPFPFPFPLPLAANNAGVPLSRHFGRALCLRAFNHLTCCCSCCFRRYTWLDARGVTPILEVILASAQPQTLVRLGTIPSFSLLSLFFLFFLSSKMRSSVCPSRYPVLSPHLRCFVDGDGVEARGHASVAIESARGHAWKQTISRNKAVSLFPTTNTKQRAQLQVHDPPTPPPTPPIRASPTEDHAS